MNEEGGPEVTARDARVMLALAWISYAYFGAIAVSLAPVLPLIKADLDLSSTEAGMLLGAFPVAYVVASMQVGKLADRLGVRSTIAAGIALIAVSCFLRVFCHSMVTLLPAVLLLGFGGPVVSTVLPKLVAEWFEGHARTVAAGVYTTGPAVGGAALLLLARPVLVPAFGSWQGMYLCLGVVGLVVLGVWLAFARATEAAGLAISDDGVEVPAVWRNLEVWIIVAVGVAAFTMGQGFSGWLPTILEDQGRSAGVASLWASLNRIVQVPGSLLITYAVARSVRLNVRRDTVVVLLVIASLSVLAITTGNPALELVALLAQGIAAGAILPLLMAMLMDLPGVDSRSRATAAALYFTVGQIAGASAPILVGWLNGLTGGFTVGLVAVAGVALLGVIPGTRLRDTRALASEIVDPAPGIPDAV